MTHSELARGLLAELMTDSPVDAEARLVLVLRQLEKETWLKVANKAKGDYDYQEQHRGRVTKTWGQGVMDGSILALRKMETWCREQASHE